jgi:hypothetical protein
MRKRWAAFRETVRNCSLMDKLIKIIFGFIIVFSFSACSDYEKQITNEINSDIDKYTELIKTIEKCNFSTDLYGKLINTDKFPDFLNFALNKTKLKNKVNFIVIDKENECQGINVEFILGNTHLQYVSCPDSEFPKPDTKEKKGNIDIIGINNNWIIWIDNDFI